jgi:hypothetical protein
MHSRSETLHLYPIYRNIKAHADAVKLYFTFYVKNFPKMKLFPNLAPKIPVPKKVV